MRHPFHFYLLSMFNFISCSISYPRFFFFLNLFTISFSALCTVASFFRSSESTYRFLKNIPFLPLSLTLATNQPTSQLIYIIIIIILLNCKKSISICVCQCANCLSPCISLFLHVCVRVCVCVWVLVWLCNNAQGRVTWQFSSFSSDASSQICHFFRSNSPLLFVHFQVPFFSCRLTQFPNANFYGEMTTISNKQKNHQLQSTVYSLQLFTKNKKCPILFYRHCHVIPSFYF